MSKDNNIKEIWKILKELIKSQKKTDEQQKKTDEQQKKTDEQLKKTDEQVRKTSKKVDDVTEMVGKMTGGWGKFVEGMVEPSIVKFASQLGIDVNVVYRRVESKTREVEADIIIEGKKNNKRVLLVVEAKSHFEADDMREFLLWFNKFFDLFDIYKGAEVMGAVASPRFGDGVEKYAQKEGLWVFVPSGDVMKLLNPEGFKPKVLRSF